jgi:hypothetical protein
LTFAGQEKNLAKSHFACFFSTGNNFSQIFAC